ncbi:MAG TPA: metal ABC transporter substrate-binding protein [Acidimicrobiia bacterium]|nr:metal ABC transporter substrate-binding protein [Acidimicrobiia bacterium]
MTAIGAGCRPDDGGTAGLDVVAGFYPVAWAAERIGGGAVTVTDLTPPGTESHDLELTTRQVDEVLDAEVVIVLGGGFQPAVEDAAARRDGDTVEVLEELPENQLVEGDPHVWLDPVLMVEVVDIVKDALVSADPGHEAGFRRNADDLRDELGALDQSFRAGLASCPRDLVVSAHDAFGYLTGRYGLRNEGVAGLSPDAEPDARRLAELADLAREEGVTTVFTEELLSPEIAETLAREAGGLRTDVLSPLESRSEAGDYLTVMADNLDKIRTALGCS